MIVGIDLGTTYSAIAYVNELGKPEILPSRDGLPVTPSVVLFQGDMPLVGDMAKRSAANAPEDAAQFVKRSMGDPHWKFETSDGQTYTPESVSALIIKRLVEDAEMVLGEGTVTDAVITVPAYFNDGQRRATRDAGTIAGLNVRRVLNEPTAAALAYGTSTQEDGIYLVYDLGGGTFDVTVMRVSGGVFDVLATDGDKNLGGFDFDNALMKLANERFMAEGGSDVFDDDVATAGLRERAEMAKRTLSSVKKTSIVVPGQGSQKPVYVTRDEFESATSHLLARTRDLTDYVVEDAGLAWSDLDRILLVGGSTRMPMVPAMITGLTGMTPERGIAVDEVVALGAAVQAALVQAEDKSLPVPFGGDVPVMFGGHPVVIRDVTSQGLGTLVMDETTQSMKNSVIIPHNTTIPAQESGFFATVVDNQTVIKVNVTQGNDDDPAFVAIVGEQELSIPPYPREAPIQLVYSYDIDQLVHIEAYDLTANRSLGSFEVENVANMSPEEVEVERDRLKRTEVG